jgi:hypothetical protein
VLLFRVYAITQITPEIPQTSLHKHGTITQITPEIPRTSLHKQHGTITQNPADIPQTSWHKNGKITQITLDIPQTSLHKHGAAQKLLTQFKLSSVLCYCLVFM